MKHQITVYSLSIFFLLTGYTINSKVLANQPLTIAQSIWKRFSSTTGNFSILMPGTPQENKRTLNNKNGTIQVHTFMVERPQEDVKYTVSYTEYPEEYIKLLHENNLVEKALEDGKNAVLRKTKGTLVSETKINLNNYAGREIYYQKPGDKIVKLRIYLVNKRLYQILAETTTKKEKFLTKSIGGFLNSFTLLNN